MTQRSRPALGKPVLLLRVKAFAIGGVVMGLAGALHAFYLTYIDPSQFTSIITAYAFMAVIAGGRGSNIGLLFGAATIMALLEAARFLKDAIQAIDGTQLAALRLGSIGVGIVLLLILRPQGLFSPSRAEMSMISFPTTEDFDDATRNSPAIDRAAAPPSPKSTNASPAMARSPTRPPCWRMCRRRSIISAGC